MSLVTTSMKHWEKASRPPLFNAAVKVGLEIGGTTNVTAIAAIRLVDPATKPTAPIALPVGLSIDHVVPTPTSLAEPVAIVSVLGEQLIQSNSEELEIEGILPGPEMLVIVDVLCAPEYAVVAEDIGLIIVRLVVAARQNAVRMQPARGAIAIYDAVVISDGRAVVVPVCRHRQGVSDERAGGRANVSL